MPLPRARFVDRPVYVDAAARLVELGGAPQRDPESIADASYQHGRRARRPDRRRSAAAILCAAEAGGCALRGASSHHAATKPGHGAGSRAALRGRSVRRGRRRGGALHERARRGVRGAGRRGALRRLEPLTAQRPRDAVAAALHGIALVRAGADDRGHARLRDALAMGETPAQRSEAAYWLAWAAFRARELSDAERWVRVALEQGSGIDHARRSEER